MRAFNLRNEELDEVKELRSHLEVMKVKAEVDAGLAIKQKRQRAIEEYERAKDREMEIRRQQELRVEARKVEERREQAKRAQQELIEQVREWVCVCLCVPGQCFLCLGSACETVCMWRTLVATAICISCCCCCCCCTVPYRYSILCVFVPFDRDRRMHLVGLALSGWQLALLLVDPVTSYFEHHVTSLDTHFVSQGCGLLCSRLAVHMCIFLFGI